MGIKEVYAKIEALKNKEVNGTECEVYSRIVGYYRPVKQWNRGKKAEREERKDFTVSS